MKEFGFNFLVSDRTLAREARDRVLVQPHRRVCRGACKPSLSGFSVRLSALSVFKVRLYFILKVLFGFQGSGLDFLLPSF